MSRPARIVFVAVLCLAGAGCSGETPDRGDEAVPATPEAVAACLQEGSVGVRERGNPSWDAAAELVAGGEAGTESALSVLFYEDEGDASSAAATLRLAGEPSIRVGTVVIVPSGPPSEDAQQAVLDCLGAELASPAP